MDSNGVLPSVKHRKCYSGIVVLFFVVLLIPKLGRVSSHQTDEVDDIDKMPSDGGMVHGRKYGVVDNIKHHEVYIIDGVMHEWYPILMYKEDFVNEHFDLNRYKMLTKKGNIARHPRYNTIKHYNVLKPRKIFSHILKQRPILISDEEDASVAKFVSELVPLVNKLKVTENVNLVSEKDIHCNRIQKITRRRKRDIKFQNPYYRRSYYYTNNKASVFYTIQPQFHGNSKTNFAIIRHPVQGKPPIQLHKIGVRGDFYDQKTTTTPDTFSRTSPPILWHDSNPDNFDFSQYDNPKPNAATDHPPGGKTKSTPQNDATGLFPAATSSTTATSRKVSNCVWAIVNCCAQTDNMVRYYCFEEFSCHGAFWGLNPCADKVRDNAISYLDRVYA